MYVQSRVVHPLRLTFPLKTDSVIWTVAMRTFCYCINGTDFPRAIVPYVLAVIDILLLMQYVKAKSC
jgi:hypothetical protein